MTALVPDVVSGRPVGQVCTGCGAVVAADAIPRLTCPGAREHDDIDHVLGRRDDDSGPPKTDPDSDNPFLRWRRRTLAYQLATRSGWDDEAFVALVTGLDDGIRAVDGVGFRMTPFTRSPELSDALGLGAAGGVWVKDETRNVSGSHKARHLFGTLLALLVSDALDLAAGRVDETPAPLAIASCGNAALAAAVVAAAARRRLLVFIPTDADPVVVDRLEALGAEVAVRPREAGAAGDPTYLALLDAVAAGAVPFTCQGNLNGLAIEGGQTLGWELASAVRRPDGPPRIDRVVVQVGGGALLSAVAAGLATDLGDLPRVHAVQPAAVHPLAGAFGRVRTRVDGGEDAAAVLADAARHRSAFMSPWQHPAGSVAHGILDDETYDWRGCVAAMLAGGGGPLVVSEAALSTANDLARSATGIDVDPTGSAGLAGLLDLASTHALHPDENVAVLFTGAVRRPHHATSGAI